MITGLERDAFTIAGRSAEALADGRRRRQPGAGARPRWSRRYRGLVGRAASSSPTRAGMAGRRHRRRGRSPAATSANRPEIAAALERRSRRPASATRETLGDRPRVRRRAGASSATTSSARCASPTRAVGDRAPRSTSGCARCSLVAVTTVGMAAIVALVVAGTRHPAAAPAARRHRAVRRRRPRRPGVDDRRARRRSADLATAFNTDVRAHRSGSSTRQRAFAGDASHQLRTPLTALRLRLEQAAELAWTPTPTGARERLDAAGAETERLQHVIDGLLALARADGETGPTGAGRRQRRRRRAGRHLAAAGRGVAACASGVDAPRPVPAACRWPAASSRSSTTSSTTRSARRAVGRGDRRSPCGRTTAAVVLTIADRGPGMTADQIARVLRPLLAGRRRRPPGHRPGPGRRPAAGRGRRRRRRAGRPRRRWPGGHRPLQSLTAVSSGRRPGRSRRRRSRRRRRRRRPASRRRCGPGWGAA